MCTLPNIECKKICTLLRLFLRLVALFLFHLGEVSALVLSTRRYSVQVFIVIDKNARTFSIHYYIVIIMSNMHISVTFYKMRINCLEFCLIFPTNLQHIYNLHGGGVFLIINNVVMLSPHI